MLHFAHSLYSFIILMKRYKVEYVFGRGGEGEGPQLGFDVRRGSFVENRLGTTGLGLSEWKTFFYPHINLHNRLQSVLIR